MTRGANSRGELVKCRVPLFFCDVISYKGQEQPRFQSLPPVMLLGRFSHFSLPIKDLYVEIK